MFERIRFVATSSRVCEEGEQRKICITYVFRLDQALVLTFLSVVLLRNIFHRLFFRRSIYLFALSDFFVNIAEDKENKNETGDKEDILPSSLVDE